MGLLFEHRIGLRLLLLHQTARCTCTAEIPGVGGGGGPFFVVDLNKYFPQYAAEHYKAIFFFGCGEGGKIGWAYRG